LEIVCDVNWSNQNLDKVSSLEREIDMNEQDRTRLLTEKGRLEQEAEVGFAHICLFYIVYTLCLRKKRATLFSSITLAFLGRFLYFVYHWKQE